MDDLRNKALTGLGWNLLERVGSQVISFLPTIVLARLLAPEQFGLVGMLALFIAVANTFLDSGFSVALIQKRDATHLDECSILYFNILVGGIAVVALFFSAPLIAAFYQQPILVELTRWMSLGILINSCGLIQATLLTRTLDFKVQLKANLFAVLFSGILGVVAAYGGLGVWSLVIQSLSGSLLRTLTLWRLSTWRPALLFSLDSLRGMFGFGSRMLLSGLIAVFFDNLYLVFIGKVFSATSLGYYTRATSLRGVVIDTTSNTIGRIMFPTLASIQDDPERLRRGYRKSAMLTSFVHFPLMVGLILIARPLITLLFSDRWHESVIFFQLMCASGLLYPLQLINLDILKVKGRSDLFLNLQVIRRILIVANILIAYRWGISAILLGQVGISLIAYVLNSFYSERLIAYSMKAQIWDVLPSLLFAGLMGGCMWLAGSALGYASNFIHLVVQTSVGVFVYAGLNWLWKVESLREMVAIADEWTTHLRRMALGNV